MDDKIRLGTQIAEICDSVRDGAYENIWDKVLELQTSVMTGKRKRSAPASQKKKVVPKVKAKAKAKPKTKRQRVKKVMAPPPPPSGNGIIPDDLIRDL
jgi:hypothetical protein